MIKSFHSITKREEVSIEATTTVVSILTEAGPALVEGVSLVWELITGNQLLLLFTGAGIAGLGFKFFRKGKRVAG